MTRGSTYAGISQANIYLFLLVELFETTVDVERALLDHHGGVHARRWAGVFGRGGGGLRRFDLHRVPFQFMEIEPV